VSSGIVSYGGPFNSKFRLELAAKWNQKIIENKVNVSPDCNLVNTIGEELKIRTWQANYELPDDSLSVENGIIIDRTKRWTLSIDPQQIATNYIKKMGIEVMTENLFKTLKAT